jgi:probable F420-dependent oxidoreductase
MPPRAPGLGPVGIWTFQLDGLPIGAARDAAAELDDLGYGALWIPEVAGRDPFVNASLLLGASERLVVGTGIAGIYSRDAISMACAQKTVAEAFPDRFLLGMGVSHQPAVEAMRGHTYGPPLATMRAYLDAMDAAPYLAAPPAAPPARVLGALGPRMLALARDRAAGAHPYLVPVEHTARAREVLGPDALLAPEQKVVLHTDPAVARARGRRALAIYLGLPNYTGNLRRFGYTDDDLADGGSDRLVDAVVAWGDEEAIRARVAAHHAAGADHVAVQVLPEQFGDLPATEWRALAPALLG